MPDATPSESQPPTFSRDSDLSGRTLGDFCLLRRLGRGAMAEIYLAEQGRLKRRVAIKILKPELAVDRTYLQRFALEAQAAASLVHANIVQIYEVGCVGPWHFIAQEYVPGQNLGDYIGRFGRPDLPHALSIMRQVAAALAKAAEQGVVHRDIKPENIMLTACGEVKVADFGLARITREGAASELTQVGITLGTPLYMSPEQIEGKALDARSDIYSFGVTCYHMLTGAPPFKGETALSVAVQHLKSRPESLENLRPDLPPALCRIVHRMMAKDPAQRYANGRELLRELRRVQLEHFGNDWPDDLPAWESLAAESLDEQHLAATKRLDALMKAATRASRRRGARAWLGASLIAAFVVGGAAAWWTVVPESLLAGVQLSEEEIGKEKTVLRQYYRASQIGTEAAWQSVIRYFPEKQYFALRAQQQLALLYLRRDDWNQAMAIFEKLADLNLEDKKTEEEFRAFGLAGQCGVWSLRGEYGKSNAILGRLAPIRDRLTSEPMRRFVANAVAKNCAKLGQQTTREWEQWLKEQFHEDS